MVVGLGEEGTDKMLRYLRPTIYRIHKDSIPTKTLSSGISEKPFSSAPFGEGKMTRTGRC